MKARIGKIKELRRGRDKVTCPLCLEKTGAKHILLRCAETKMWKTEFLGKKWLKMNEELVYRTITNCTNRTQISNIRQKLNRISYLKPSGHYMHHLLTYSKTLLSDHIMYVYLCISYCSHNKLDCFSKQH
jgi:hypothetical protein